MAEFKKCAHEGCNCQVEADQTYCCQACEKADKEGTGGGCDCEHSGCGQE